MPVHDLLTRIPSSELTEWRAYYILQDDPNAGESEDEFIKRTMGDV